MVGLRGNSEEVERGLGLVERSELVRCWRVGESLVGELGEEERQREEVLGRLERKKWEES